MKLQFGIDVFLQICCLYAEHLFLRKPLEDCFCRFKKRLLNLIRSLPNKVANPHNPQGIKLFARLRFGLSHLHDHEFKHNFLDTINPLCSYGYDIKTNSHYFLYCSNFLDESTTPQSKISKIDNDILTCTDYKIVETPLFELNQFNNYRVLDILP